MKKCHERMYISQQMMRKAKWEKAVAESRIKKSGRKGYVSYVSVCHCGNPYPVMGVFYEMVQ